MRIGPPPPPGTFFIGGTDAVRAIERVGEAVGGVGASAGVGGSGGGVSGLAVGGGSASGSTFGVEPPQPI